MKFNYEWSQDLKRLNVVVEDIESLEDVEKVDKTIRHIFAGDLNDYN